MLLFFLRDLGLLRISNFELRISFPAPDHAHTIPMVGTGRFASTPAKFPPMRRERAPPRLHKPNRLARSGSEPMGQIRILVLERPAIDKVASLKSKYVASHSLFVKTLKR